MAKERNIGTYLCYILRHHPESIGLNMDQHGWVSIPELIEKVNANSDYQLSEESLKSIVDTDEKGRYRCTEDFTKMRCCQGHSIPWVIPKLHYDREVPAYLYHGTTMKAWEKIQASGSISKMQRHAVHMHNEKMAWKSAKRWHLTPVVLKINAAQMAKEGYIFGVSDNGVWCTEDVPVKYVAEVLTEA